nr:hypothetical protein [Tanacetum cinerariifolium]
PSAASHVAASYWTATSDVAATSAPVNAVGQRRSTPPANDSQRRQITVVIDGQQRRITVVIGGQPWRTTTVADGGPSLTAARPPLTTTVDRSLRVKINNGRKGVHTRPHHRTTCQRGLVSWSKLGMGRVWIGSGPGPPRGMPRVCHVCTRVPTWHHVASTWMLMWIICTKWDSTL